MNIVQPRIEFWHQPLKHDRERGMQKTDNNEKNSNLEQGMLISKFRLAISDCIPILDVKTEVH